MHDIKEIIDGIAHSVNMSKDALVQAYPQLRTEYAWYGALGDTKWFFLILGIAGIITIFLLFMDGLDLDYENDKKRVIFLSVSVAICAIIFVVLNFLQYIVAPDISLIMDIMNTVQNN